MNESLPVLIVGAGPVGLSLATALARQGTAVQLFEAQLELPDEIRASTFHPAALDAGSAPPVPAAAGALANRRFRDGAAPGRCSGPHDGSFRGWPHTAAGCRAHQPQCRRVPGATARRPAYVGPGVAPIARLSRLGTETTAKTHQ